MKIIEVVAAVIFDSNNKILIARRGSTKSLAGKWEFPGGKVEQGEDHQTALKRELLEEMNITIEVKHLLGVNQHLYDGFIINLHAYKTEYISGEFKLTDHDSVEWVQFENLNNFDFAEADIPLISKCNPDKFSSNYT